MRRTSASILVKARRPLLLYTVLARHCECVQYSWTYFRKPSSHVEYNDTIYNAYILWRKTDPYNDYYSYRERMFRLPGTSSRRVTKTWQSADCCSKISSLNNQALVYYLHTSSALVKTCTTLDQLVLYDFKSREISSLLIHAHTFILVRDVHVIFLVRH